MNPIDIAIMMCGGPTALAKKLGFPHQSTVSNWKSRGNIPPEYCAAIEAATDGAVTRKDLRPDDWERIWPELADKAAA